MKTNTVIKKVHISTIKRGDTVIHDSKMKTVCKHNLGKDSLLGYTLFGDSYCGGNKLVELVTFVCK